MAALLHQRHHQGRLVEFDIQDQGAGNELFRVMLGQEGGQHFHLDRFLGNRRRIAELAGEIGAVAQVAPAAHHGQVDAGAPALHQHGDDVHVGVARRFHALLVQHARQRGDLVAHHHGLLEFELGGKGVHLLFQVRQHFALAPAQEARRVFHVVLVVFLADQVHARRAAAADLVQQARPRAVGVHAVLAGADEKNLLQDLHRFLDGPGTGERPEILVFLVHRAPVIHHARRIAIGDFQIRIRFIIAEQDVVARLQRLDQVVFQDQRFRLAVRDGRFQARDALDHHGDAGAGQVLLKIAGNALLQVARLAHVQHLVGSIEVAVHAGQVRQFGDGGQHLRARVGRRFRHGLLQGWFWACFGHCWLLNGVRPAGGIRPSGTHSDRKD